MGITVTGLDVAIKGLRKAGPQLDHALGEVLQQAVPTAAAGEMRGRMSGLGRAGARAAGTIQVGRETNGVRVQGGGGDPWFKGEEFGGRKRRKTRHVVHSRNGRAYVVNKRTTMMFPPSVGTRGYAVTPVVRRRLSGIRKKLTDRLAREVSGA